jgi:hypothetical protein
MYWLALGYVSGLNAYNPSQKLKERFPMCDAFLKVKWIDKKKKIGYSRYDLHRNKGEWENLALIHLDANWPSFRYDIKDWQKKVRSKSYLH